MNGFEGDNRFSITESDAAVVSDISAYIDEDVSAWEQLLYEFGFVWLEFAFLHRLIATEQKACGGMSGFVEYSLFVLNIPVSLIKAFAKNGFQNLSFSIFQLSDSLEMTTNSIYARKLSGMKSKPIAAGRGA